MGFALILCPARALSETKFSVSILNDTQCKITGCSSNKPTIVIPNVIDDRAVTAIASDAFKNNTTMKRLELPDSLEDIGNFAFRDCEALESLSLGRGLKCWLATRRSPASGYGWTLKAIPKIRKQRCP